MVGKKVPMVSVIIPAYNREKVLARAIDSVINQSFTDWELLIVDDRSTDSTKSLIERINHSDNRIRYLFNGYEQGPGGARNFGIDHSSGKYIAFLDSDDLWYPDHLEECLQICQTESVKICCGLWFENKNGITIEGYPRKSHLDTAISELSPIIKDKCIIFNRFFCEYVSIRGYYFLKTSFLVINRDILMVAGKFDTKLRTNQDVDFFFRITIYREVALANKVHGVYFQGDDNLYFFKDAWKIFDKDVVLKLNFHRRYHLQCYKKRLKIIKTEKDFIFKSLMKHYAYWTIQYTYGFLASINEPFYFFRSKYYLILKKIYLWRCSVTNKKGNNYFHYSFQHRFRESMTFGDFKKLLIKSILKLDQDENKMRYYIFIENHIILAKSKDSLSLYNPSNERVIYLKSTTSEVLRRGLDNNILQFNIKEIRNPSFFFFIMKLYQNQIGGLISSFESTTPIEFQNTTNVKKIYFENKFLISHQSAFLTEITFYIVDQCMQECDVCQMAFRQNIYCTCSNSGLELNLDLIKKAISDLLPISTPIINVIGGNLFQYKRLNELHHFLLELGINIKYYINYLNINNIDNLSLLVAEKSTITILINPSDVENMDLEKLLSIPINNIKYKFLIKNSEEIDLINHLCKHLGDERVDIEPFFTGENRLFFEKNIFLSRREILKNIEVSHVRMRSLVNIENIGKLFVLPNGDVLSNMNELPLGNIYRSSLVELMSSNTILESSWFQIRNSVEPCRNCTLNPFCPSISNFEYELGHKICTDV